MQTKVRDRPCPGESVQIVCGQGGKDTSSRVAPGFISVYLHDLRLYA